MPDFCNKTQVQDSNRNNAVNRSTSAIIVSIYIFRRILFWNVIFYKLCKNSCRKPWWPSGSTYVLSSRGSLVQTSARTSISFIIQMQNYIWLKIYHELYTSSFFILTCEVIQWYVKISILIRPTGELRPEPFDSARPVPSSWTNIGWNDDDDEFCKLLSSDREVSG